MDFLGLSNQIQINTAEPAATINSKAIKETCSISLIEDYDQTANDFKFQQSQYTCNVCFVEKSGIECFRYIPCDHVYCNQCMKEYFEVQISDGKVTSLTCPYEKCESQALPLQVDLEIDLSFWYWDLFFLFGLQVSKLLNDALYKKYETLLIRNSLNNMADILYCPRVHCQSPVIPVSMPGKTKRLNYPFLCSVPFLFQNLEEENMARCPSCQYVFCTMCRQGFHGIEPCKLSNCKNPFLSRHITSKYYNYLEKSWTEENRLTV